MNIKIANNATVSDHHHGETNPSDNQAGEKTAEGVSVVPPEEVLTLLALPDEFLLYIANHLPFDDIRRFALTKKRLLTLFNTEEQLKVLSGRYYGSASEVYRKIIENRDIPAVPNNEINDPLLRLDNPEVHGAAAKPLDLYSVSHYADLQQQQKINSRKDLFNLVKDNIQPFFASVPGCGHFNPIRFLNVMLSLCESSYQDAFPKKIIGVGSGQGFLEKCFGLMGGVNVKCYDLDPCNEFIPVEQAEFPKDIEKCLPDDCSNCVLVSAYPQGYLGSVLSEFIRRGGEMLCTTVEGSLFCVMHEGYEDNPDVLNEGIKELRKKNGEFFEVKLTGRTMGAPSCIQFYNWPSSVKQSMFDSQELKSLCSDIHFTVL